MSICDAHLYNNLILIDIFTIIIIYVVLKKTKSKNSLFKLRNVGLKDKKPRLRIGVL